MQTDHETAPLWQKDESLRTLVARLADQPRDIRVVSFDFFDTLVSRVCAEPNELFIEVGRRLASQGHLLTALTPAEFRAARIAADEAARKRAIANGKLGEVKLADIYAELKNVVRNPAAARDLEFDVERTFCYLNPVMASLVQHVRSLGYRTAVMSDTYFTAAELQRILRENGLSTALFDGFLVSCERSAAKWNGALYQELFRQFDIHPNELLHIGDNQHADVHIANQYRVEPVHYYRTTPDLETIFNSERTQRGARPLPAAALNSLRVLVARCAESDTDAFRDGAMVFGPVLARYADWCVEKFAASGVTTVLALMREGEVLGELLQRAADAAGVKLNIVPCFASRMSTARAALSDVSPERASELLEGSAGLTPQAVLDILGIGVEAEKLLDPATRNKPLTSHENIRGLVKLLFSLPRLRQLIEEKRAQSHELAFAYLSALVGNDSTIGMVDLGWSGSIQRNIARILRRGGREIRTVGCYLACTKRAGRLALEGDVAHGYIDYDWCRMTILPEIAITAMCGSTNGYARDAAGQVQPVLGEFEINAAERTAKERLRVGILTFQGAWLTLRQNKANAFTPEMLADIDGQSAAIFYRLLEFPTKPEADRLGILTHDENYFGHTFTAPLCDDASPKRLRQDGLSSLFQNSRCYWPQGVIARANPRLMSSLRAPWSDPLGLGRIGAWNGSLPHDPGVTHDELVSVTALVRAFAPDQVVFVGPYAASLEKSFGTIWNDTHGDSTQPRLIVAGDATEQPSAEFSVKCAVVSGDPSDVRMMRGLRSKLISGGNIALVFSGETNATRAKFFLAGLAPFLGGKGIVLTACGRYDRHTLGEQLPLVEAVNEWATAQGGELGFGLWAGTATARAALCDWVVFRRDSESLVWNKQWMLTPEEFALPVRAA
jgi:predicted HAD superfamily hydrolase